MFKYLKLLLACLLTCFFSCSSSDDEDCMKTITIPQYYFYNNQTFSYESTQEVPCDAIEPTEPEEIEPQLLENIDYEVLVLELVTDSNTNTSRLHFEIKLNNPNNYSITGVPVITLDSDGTQVTSSFSSSISNSCSEIEANSSCTLIFDEEDSLDKGVPNSIEIVDVKYLLTN